MKQGKAILVNIIGLFQGLALVAFPAASTVLTNPSSYGFTNTMYGSLFIPQAILSILVASLNFLFFRYLGANRTLCIGLVANLLAMALLALSALATGRHPLLPYGMLLIATGCLGTGFGLVVPTLNQMTEDLHPDNSDTAVLTLNAMLGVGTALAPVFTAIFLKLGFWWGLPLCLALAFTALIFVHHRARLPEHEVILGPRVHGRAQSSAIVVVFVAFAFLYGVVETLNGNWILIYMSQHLHASINLQSFALTAFWGMVTVGRLFFGAVSKYISEQLAFQMAPFISMVAFVIIGLLVSGQEYWAILAFGLTGFGCSVLLPLLISFGGKQLSAFSASVPGMMISSYLLGYGVAAFGVGPLEDFAHISLRGVYFAGAVISFALGILSLYIVQKQTSRPIA